jgi:N-acetylglucosamine-6-phosphate deacetylase
VTVVAAARLFESDVSDDLPAWMQIDAGRVVATGTGRPPAGDVVDCSDAFVAPGYLDVQCNGFGSTDFATCTTDGAAELLTELRAYGVTGCCPTLVTAPLDAYAPMLERLAGLCSRTEMLGVHLEGPFLGGAPGAHPVDLMRAVDIDWLRALLDRFPGLVRIMTLAPEADPGFEATRMLTARGVVVALGHSTASYDDARRGADAGARLVTHLFNGMGALHHRAPGLPGAALDDARLTPSLIADLLHVQPALVRLAVKARPDLVAVSDAVAVDGVEVVGHDGAAYLRDGTLAGSVLTMERAVQNLVAIGVPASISIATATANPAHVLGLTDRGRLVPGARADYVVLDPATLAVRATHVAGS